MHQKGVGLSDKRFVIENGFDHRRLETEGYKYNERKCKWERNDHLNSLDIDIAEFKYDERHSIFLF